MGETISVIAGDALSPLTRTAAGTVAKLTGRVAFDVTREIRENVGILASRLSRDQADRIVGALGNAGIAAFAVDETEFVRFPDPVFLETARLGDGALEVADLRDAESRRLGAIRVPYGDVVLLVTAIIKTETEKRVVSGDASPGLSVGAPGAEGLLGVHHRGFWFHGVDTTDRTVRVEKKTDYDHALDLFAVEPAQHIRLNASTFNFVQTGLKMQPTSIANLAQFITHLAPHCTQAFVDPSIRRILDGNPFTNVKFDSPGQYDAYLSWRIQVLYHPQGS